MVDREHLLQEVSVLDSHVMVVRVRHTGGGTKSPFKGLPKALMDPEAVHPEPINGSVVSSTFGAGRQARKSVDVSDQRVGPRDVLSVREVTPEEGSEVKEIVIVCRNRDALLRARRYFLRHW